MSCCRKTLGYQKALDALISKAADISDTEPENALQIMEAISVFFEKQAAKGVPKDKPEKVDGFTPPKATDPKVQKALGKYYAQCRSKQKGYSKEQCARTAWSIICTNVFPDYEGCTSKGKDLGKSPK